MNVIGAFFRLLMTTPSFRLSWLYRRGVASPLSVMEGLLMMLLGAVREAGAVRTGLRFTGLVSYSENNSSVVTLRCTILVTPSSLSKSCLRQS